MKVTLNQNLIKPVIFSLLLVLLIFIASNFIVSSRLDNYVNQVTLQAAEQRTLLVSIAEAISRGGADSVTEKIVVDCSLEERDRFDSLLSRINSNLNQTELTELDRLFGRCGSFFADRKAVLATRLEREVEIYQAYVAQLEQLVGDRVVRAYQVPEWQQLVALELKQSSLFSELVDTQDEIISLLLSGESSQSDEIKTILIRVGDVQGSLTVADKQAEDLRANLIQL